ncbi:DNA replication and repair protein RecF [Brumimicrobium salinarum]|uniref:DNA replication and repair protein RecF n=1 Tax=Brumimicrobium salinarum TaxID=2058658 RepID=A0A2I0R4R3_9FLAO|nr:DNA replication/repair protein RecF [Brumimicrobium salinarum]PKR81584.1 DNA replication and repair protein RecF [Brumimicrobium salinarum]
MNNHVFVSKLSLVNFKNYKQADLSLSPDINCFIGENGAGKTNVLDAVYYLSMCKSYLNPVDRQNILFDASFFVIQSSWNKKNEVDQIYCGVKKGQKKVFKKNKVTYEKLADHIGQFPTVMISPYDRNLILEGSEIRRKWMDGIISQFDRNFLSQLIKYGKVLNQRNALLKNMSSYGFFDNESISVWDEQLIECGKVIHEARKKTIEEFIPIFQKYYNWLSGSKEEVNLSYRSQLFDKSFEELLEEAQSQDQRRQYTTVGVHKDDFIFTIKDHPIKKFGSQGQQKTYLIALKLAQYEWLLSRLKLKPVLLLDDIFDKLDNERVERLMQMVSDQDFGQVLITDTDQERIDEIFSKNGIDYKSFFIKDNIIEESKNKVTVE